MRLNLCMSNKSRVPQAPVAECEAIAKLVQRCLKAKGQDVGEFEGEINDRVASLYGLTRDERKIVTEAEAEISRAR